MLTISLIWGRRKRLMAVGAAAVASRQLITSVLQRPERTD